MPEGCESDRGLSCMMLVSFGRAIGNVVKLNVYSDINPYFHDVSPMMQDK